MKAHPKALEMIAREGIAVSDGDVTEGIAAVGAAVFNRRGEPVAAVSVSGMRRVALEDGGSGIGGPCDRQCHQPSLGLERRATWLSSE